MFFKYFSRHILFSRTFQDSPVYSSTFQACANPGQKKAQEMAVYMLVARSMFTSINSSFRCNGQFFPQSVFSPGKDLTSQFFPHPVSFSPHVIFSEKA